MVTSRPSRLSPGLPFERTGMIIGSPFLALLALALLALLFGRTRHVHAWTYAGCTAVSVLLAGDGIFHLIQSGREAVPVALLPVGLPGLGAHFRLDSLSEFFLVAINVP